MKRRTLLLLITACLSLILVGIYGFYLLGIQRSSSDSTLGYLQESQCSLPCWENIVPSQTSESDVLIILKKLMYINDSRTSVEDDEVYFKTKTGDHVSIFFQNGKTLQIDITPRSPVPLSEVVDKLGEPEKVHIDIQGEHEICQVAYLFYAARGVIIAAGECEEMEKASRFESGNVMPETSVVNVSFVKTADDPESMVPAFWVMGLQPEETIGKMFPWEGYGYYPPQMT